MPIDSFPIEVWEEIFEWLYADGEVPLRNHALVCTRWRQILLSLPILWRKVEINPAYQGSPEDIHDQLVRRLHHAKNTTLDVTISKVPRSLKPEQLHYTGLLITLVRLAPVERWHSLSILGGTYTYPGLNLHEIFSARFTSLRALTLLGYDSSFRPYSGLLDLIARSNPPLEHLNIQSYTFPQELAPLLRQPSIKTLCGTLGSLDPMLAAPLPHIDQITLDGWWWEDPEMSSSQKNFRECTVIVLNYRPSLIWALEARNVTNFQVDWFSGWGKSNVFLELPSVHTMHLRPCKPQLMQAFKAPKLQVLKLSKAHKGSERLPLKVVRRENKAHIIPLFRRTRRLLTSYPTSLTIDVEEITDGALVIILEAWPQLKRLFITLGNDFDCFGIFAKRLLDRLSPCVPKWRRWT
ncbi:hypothetical protein FRC18_000590 [Serendipita sp. 400]|nr:hypothetical protein FRC18_000590 [Serendipita sp. 400]